MPQDLRHRPVASQKSEQRKEHMEMNGVLATLVQLSNGIFLTQACFDISRSNMIFQQMKPETSVIPHFHVILTGQSIYCIILMTGGHLQGQKVNFKIK